MLKSFHFICLFPLGSVPFGWHLETYADLVQCNTYIPLYLSSLVSFSLKCLSRLLLDFSLPGNLLFIFLIFGPNQRIYYFRPVRNFWCLHHLKLNLVKNFKCRLTIVQVPSSSITYHRQWHCCLYFWVFLWENSFNQAITKENMGGLHWSIFCYHHLGLFCEHLSIY